MAANKKPPAAGKHTTLYDVIEKWSEAHCGTHENAAQAKREATRLSKEAHEGQHLHLGQVKEYEVRSRSGLVVA